MQPGRLAEPQDFRQVFGMEHRLAAGKGHAAAGGLVELPVLQKLLDQLLRLIAASDEVQRGMGAVVGAFAAGDAPAAVQQVPSLRRNGVDALRANRRTFPAACAGAFQKLKRGSGKDAFRIMAPGAAEVAPLEKDGGADAGAVVQ